MSQIPKTWAYHQMVLLHIQDTCLRGDVLPLYKDTVGVFYGPSQLGQLVDLFQGTSIILMLEYIIIVFFIILTIYINNFSLFLSFRVFGLLTSSLFL